MRWKLPVVVAMSAALSVAAQTHAAIYYVSTSGNDTTGTGTEAAPWATPQKCVNAGSPLVAGDTCLVKPGTYTDTDGNGITVYITSSAPLGTVAQPITIKSETPLGAIIKVREDSTLTQTGFFVSRANYTIEGFDIDGSGGTGTSSNTQSGIALWASGGTIKRNKIHHMGRQFCSDSVNAMTGVYIAPGTSGHYIGYNEFYTIGRKRGVVGFQESGCTLTPGGQGTSAHDHAIYASQTTDVTVERNVVWDTQRGYHVHQYRSSALTNTNFKIEHNTFFGDGNPGVGPTTQILLNNSNVGALIRNNNFSTPRTEVAFPFNVTFSGGSVFRGNRTTVGTWWKTATPAGIDMTSPGTLSTTMGFTNSGAQDFSLASTSGAIDAGTATGVVKSGSAEDVGAFERFGFVSATFDGTFLDVVTDAVFLPLQLLSGVTGWSVACTGCGTPVVNSATVINGGGTIRLLITGVTTCSAGGYTVTFNGATGSVTDSINIGSHLNQPLHTHNTFAVSHTCTGGSSIPAGAVIRYEMNENTGTTLTNTGSLGAAANGTISGGGTWGTGHSGAGVVLTAQSAQYVTVPYGNAKDPSVTDITVAFFVNIDPSITSLNRTFWGVPLGTNQRAYSSMFGGDFRAGVQASNDATAGNIAVTSGWHHICHEFDKTTLVSTLYIDGVASTAAGAVKSYTSYAWSGDIELGRLAGSANGPGGTFDKFTVYESVGKCAALYAADQPSAPAPAGTFTLQSLRWESAKLLASQTVDVRSTATSYRCVAGGCIALHVQLKCDNVAACLTTAFPLYYAYNGGAFTNAVPNTATAHGIFMYGPVSDTDTNHFAAVGPITAGLTHQDGSTTTVDVTQAQSYTVNQNTSLTMRYLICFKPGTQGNYFEFKPKQTGGIDFGTYSITPRIDVISPQANGGN